jgi:PAS domain S-box-containing protein
MKKMRQKNASRAVLQPESTFKNFFENTLEGIFQTSIEGKLLAANLALAKMFGYDSPEDLMEHITDVGTQVYVEPKRRTTLLRVMKKKGILINFESQILRKDGSTLWVKENIWSIKNTNGEIAYFEGTMHDISVRKKAEESRDKLLHERIAREEAEKTKNEVAKLYKEAREGNRIRDEFLNIASHELKTPLTSLQLQIQLLQRMSFSAEKHPELKVTLSACDAQIRRLTKLINNLLDVARISNQKLQIEKERMDLADVAKDVLIRHETVAKAAGSRIHLINGKRVIGLWDKSKIDQVATNLVSNAIKYGDGKLITVTVKQHDNMAELSVKDRGIGIEKEDANRIFDKFARSSVSRKYGGVGLGLYITRQIVRAHGGSIMVKSSPKRGAEFIVRLPIRKS